MKKILGAVLDLPANQHSQSSPILQIMAESIGWQILKGSQDLLHTFSIALYYKWNVKNDFPYVLQFFSLISVGLGGVKREMVCYFIHIPPVSIQNPSNMELNDTNVTSENMYRVFDIKQASKLSVVLLSKSFLVNYLLMYVLSSMGYSSWVRIKLKQ